MTFPGLRAENNRLYEIEGPCKIGRDVDCKICLNDIRVSRQHASLMIKGGFLYIKDERSSNGTYVNGIRINRQTLLQDGDKVRVGDVLLHVEYPPAPTDVAGKTLVENVTPYEDTGVSVSAGIQNMPAPPAGMDEPAAEPEEGDQDGQQASPQRRVKKWRKLVRSRPWLLWAAIVLGAFLFLAVIIGIKNAFRPAPPQRPAPAPTVVADSSVSADIGSEGGEVHNNQGVFVSAAKGAFDQTVALQLSHVESSSPNLPALPAGLEALGDVYEIDWQPAQTPEGSLQVEFPISTASNNSLLAAYRISGGGWQSLGGLIYDDKLRFDLDSPSTLRLALLRSSGSYGQYRPVLLENSADVALIVRPWQWWLPPNVMTPGTASLSAMGINLQSRQSRELESSLGEGFYGYASLPYGTYSSWCVSWQNQELKQTVYAIVNQPVSLTPYSCTWENYRIGECEPEKAAFEVRGRDMGNLLSCSEAGKSP